MGNCTAGLYKNQIIASGSYQFVDVGLTGNSSRPDQLDNNSCLTQNVIKTMKDKNLFDYYQLNDSSILGAGMNGKVVSCRHIVTSIQYALKTLHKSDFRDEHIHEIKSEIDCMARLDHPNILRVHEVFETDDTFYLVLELCHGGNLEQRLQLHHGNCFRERLACKYIHSILSAIVYCHAHNVVHRDLKLENAVFENESYESELKLIGKFCTFICVLSGSLMWHCTFPSHYSDFGLSRYLRNKDVVMHQ